jgi:outer membrane protein assembly factor BamB
MTRLWSVVKWTAFALTAVALCPVVSCGSGGGGAAPAIPSTTAASTLAQESTTSAVTSLPPPTLAVPPLAGDLVVAAINLADATPRWTSPKTDELRGVSDVIAGDGLVFVRSGYCGNFVGVALNPTSGAVVWRTDPVLAEVGRNSGVTGLVASGVVVVPSSSQRLVGLDTATGHPLWTSDVGELAAESDSLVVLRSPIDGSVHVLDRVTGKQDWSVPTNPPSTPNPHIAKSVSAAVDGDRVYLRAEADVTAYAAKTGKQQWTTPVGSMDGAIVLRGLDVVLTQSNGGVVALDAADGRQRWFLPNNTGTEQLGLSDAKMADGNLYLPVGPSVSALDLATGEPRWPMPSGLSMIYPLAAGDGRVLLSASGRLQLLDAATGTTLWTGSTPTAPSAAVYTLDRDNLYLAWSCGGG